MAKKAATQPSIPDTNIEAQTAALDPKAERRRQKEEAKRAKKEAKLAKKGGKKGKAGLIFAILIPLILVGGVAAIVAFNPLNLRDGALAPILLNVPIVSDFVQLPEMYDGEIAPPDPAQLSAEIESMSAEIDALENEVARLTQLNQMHLSSIGDLQAQVLTQDVLEANREAFEREAATAAPEAFTAWFEAFDPERAAEIFAEIVESDAREQEYRAYIADILAMEEGAVADVFESMIPVDTELVVAIVRRLPPAFSGEVLSAMEAENAALIIRQMYPGDFFDDTVVEVE
ncbi:MAG: hypothetical protein FWE20_01880 [Defluviitaleaceae bacterium]|nr:hypothetical protein [Defluviitaleaceae bacterium]